MNKQTKRKPALKKQHIEILFEDLKDQFRVVAESVSSLNDKIDTKTDALADEIRKNREETIFLIKASIDGVEERLTKKIEDGDNAVIEQLTKKIEDGDKAVIEQLTKKIEDGDNAVIEQLTKKIDDNIRSMTEHSDQRFDEINHKIDGINDTMKAVNDTLNDHEHRISSLEHTKKDSILKIQD